VGHTNFGTSEFAHSIPSFSRQCPAPCGCKALPSTYCPETSYPRTGLAALPQQPRRLHHTALVTRGIASRAIFTPNSLLCYLAMCLTSAPARTLATGRNVSITAHVSVSQPQAAVGHSPSQPHLLRVRALLPAAGLREGGRRRRARVLGLLATQWQAEGTAVVLRQAETEQEIALL
jgi:hypothetical protein